MIVLDLYTRLSCDDQQNIEQIGVDRKIQASSQRQPAVPFK